MSTVVGPRRAPPASSPATTVLITLDGIGAWTHERHFLEGEPTGMRITTWVGSFDWSKDTGESGNCTYDLTRTVDTAGEHRHARRYVLRPRRRSIAHLARGARRDRRGLNENARPCGRGASCPTGHPKGEVWMDRAPRGRLLSYYTKVAARRAPNVLLTAKPAGRGPGGQSGDQRVDCQEFPHTPKRRCGVGRGRGRAREGMRASRAWCRSRRTCRRTCPPRGSARGRARHPAGHLVGAEQHFGLIRVRPHPGRSYRSRRRRCARLA